MKRIGLLTSIGLILIATGCGKKPSAIVDFEYTLQPKEPLAEQYMSIAVYDARMAGDKGEFDEKKWSEMTADLVQYHLQQAAENYEIPIKLVDREHLTITMEEKDLAAADITDAGDEIASAQVEGATAILTSEVTVKVDKQKGKGRTVSSIGGFAGRWGGGGHAGSSEVDKESRNITVTCAFALKDAANNSAIAAHNGKPAQHYERGKTSPFFGGSKTESDMTPRDKVIGEIVEAELQKFLVKFVPTEVTAQVTVKAGAHEMSEAGVRSLRIEDYETALANFKAAIAEEPDDHKSCFGAGVCCEKLGNMDDATKYYKTARSIKPKEPVYGESLNRVSTVG